MIVDLPMTVEGHNAIVVFVDHLSKMVRIIPSHNNLDTKGFAKLFFTEVFAHYGMPSQIISDRGNQWNNEFFKDLCDYADIRLTMSTSHHPQTNGLVERSNEVIETAVRHYVNSDHSDWNLKLPFIEFALNATKKEATGTTPFHMNRITLPRNPFQAVVSNEKFLAELNKKGELSTSWMGISHSCGYRTGIQARHEFEFAKMAVEQAKEKMKMAHDKKGVKRHLYSVGDRVWLNYKHISLRHPSQRHKLVPRYFGPVTVLKMVGLNAVQLELPTALKLHPVVPVNLLKPYIPRQGVDLPAVQVNGREEYELEAIVNHKIHKSKGQSSVSFEVHWKGNYENTFQEMNDFLPNSAASVRDYLFKCTEKHRKVILDCLTPHQKEIIGDICKRPVGRPRKV
jgi:putative transposase